MAGIRDLLRTALDDISEDDLLRFRLSLSNDLPEGVKPIGKGRLEKKGVIEIVERMVEVHGEEGAGRVTLHVLRKIDQHDLAQRLEKDLGGNDIAQAVPPCPEGQGQNGASSRTTSGPGPLVSIQCDGGKVQAPTISQSTFSGDVHFNFK
ncbi:hypothetical protein ANANG_G00294400 [Anguilla anguilla]|uniref:Pyrin domain-containing protein n=1 Tax=Anguilla anguilla TaxID=7936 RepID=A0A9D3LLK1_ANGAN|nr:hypothetical protein ANANG_G00294400 [Anguilla anguilla]